MISWIVSNWQTVLLIVLTCLGALVAVLKVVAPLTPTEADNRILGVLARVVEFLSAAVTPKMKPPV